MSILNRSGYENLDEDEKRPSGRKSQILLLLALGTVAVAVTLIVLNTSPSTTIQETGFVGQSAPEQGENNDQPRTKRVRINDGRLEGKILESRGGREYFAFYNIPYAKPPLGELRFEPPQEYTEGWRGTRNATEPGDRCIQKKIGESDVKGSEDCLYLAVFTPKIPSFWSRSSELLPVMVYILGGGFIGGRASSYGGDYFMDTDVIIVLPEYRLGTMGNMNTEDHVVPGNMGFKDQVMALKWVQKNIKKFGGDPKKVTIFGNSSGGMAVHAHIYSIMSKGLFHRAITQSGSALGLNCTVRNPRERAEDIAMQIGCTQVNDTKLLVDCLKGANASDIILAQSSELTGLTVEPIPEDGDTSQVFLSDTPLNLLLKGEIQSDVPWILGINSAELGASALILNSSELTQGLTHWDEVGPPMLQLDVGSASPGEMSQMALEIRDFYFGTKNMSLETRWEFINMLSDRAWVHPTYVTALLYGNRSTSPVYLYWLTYESPDGGIIGDKLGEVFDPPFGVSHAEEVHYLFPYAKFPLISLGSADANFSVKMVDIWATFAAGEKDTPLLVGEGEEWLPLRLGNESETDKNGIQWLELNEEPQMVEIFQDRMTFWDSFPLSDLYLANVTYK